MRVRVDFKTDPISFKVLSHSGIESKYMSDGKILDITIDCAIEAPGRVVRAPSKRATNSASKKFSSLSECEKVVRDSFVGHRLTKNDRHVIGTLWAYLERKHLA